MTQLDVKPFQQETAYSCTAAAAQSLFHYFGFDLDHKTAIKLTKCDENDGCHLKWVAHLCKKLCGCRYKTIKSISEIQRHIDLSRPILAGDDYTYKDDHAILIVGYDQNNFSVLDPNTAKINLVDKNHVFEHSDEFIAIFK